MMCKHDHPFPHPPLLHNPAVYPFLFPLIPYPHPQGNKNHPSVPIAARIYPTFTPIPHSIPRVHSLPPRQPRPVPIAARIYPTLTPIPHSAPVVHSLPPRQPRASAQVPLHEQQTHLGSNWIGAIGRTFFAFRPRAHLAPRGESGVFRDLRMLSYRAACGSATNVVLRTRLVVGGVPCLLCSC